MPPFIQLIPAAIHHKPIPERDGMEEIRFFAVFDFFVFEINP